MQAHLKILHRQQEERLQRLPQRWQITSSRILPLLLLLLLLSGCRGKGNNLETPYGVSKNLVVLFTGDMHSNMERYPALAKIVERERTAARESGIPLLLLGNGDAPMGTIYHTLFDSIPFDYRAMEHIGFDAYAPGNHDFDFGPIHFDREPYRCSFPILCANLNIGAEPYIVRRFDSLTVAITGVLGEDAANTTTCISQLGYRPAAQALSHLEMPQTDYTIVLSHGGSSWVGSKQIIGTSASQMRKRAKTEDGLLAKVFPRADLIASAHDHASLPVPLMVGGTIIGNSGCNLDYLCKVVLAKDSAGRTRLMEYELIPLTEESSELCSAIHSVENHFSNLYGIRLCDTILQYSLSDSVALQDLVAESYAYVGDPSEGNAIGVVPFGLVRGALPENGMVRWMDLFNILPLGYNQQGYTGYPLVKCWLYGSEILDICELDASYAAPGNDLHLHFSSNLKYYGRALGIPFFKVTEARLKGETIEKKRLYTVVTDTFTAQSISLLRSSSMGLLSAVPKDVQGGEISGENLKDFIISSNGKALTGWMALGRYLLKN